MNKTLNKLTDLLFYLCILIFTVGLNLQDNPPNGWYQQFLPDLNNMPISDIEFLDSLTGFAVTGSKTVFDTNYILKTTNGGDNWFISYKEYNNYFRVMFINNSTGYVCGSSFQINGIIYKTTNTGENWFSLNTPFGSNYDDMSVLNEDTIWVVDNNSFDGGVFRTTNGGQSWTQQYDPTNKIYMFNGNMGFISRGGSNGSLYKTTNSGMNWTQILLENGFVDMYFIDSLTGWKAKGSMKKTTNGGLNWQTQTLPSGGGIIVSQIIEFKNVNIDTIWGVGSRTSDRGLIYLTTNSGGTWGYQLPDTNINIWEYWHINFVDKLNGWSYYTQTGVHTVTGGGDTTYYTGIKLINNNLPVGFILYQNYPNPFNPVTKIKFEIPKSTFAKLVVYNMLGEEIATLVNERLSSGSYEVDWNAPSGSGSNYPSGVYFYRLTTIDFSETKRMVLIK